MATTVHTKRTQTARRHQTRSRTVSREPASCGVTRRSIPTWLQPKPGVWFPTLDKALAAHARRRHGGDKQVNITVDAQLKQQLHDHVISLWRGLWVPPASYVRAKWLRLQAAAKIVAKPFSDEQYASFKTEWRLSERIPDGAKARRLEAEKPESILNYFNGCNETIGDETVHHFGLMEVLSWPCDTRNGKTRSFADCLASGEERMGGADESCLMKAAKEARGVGPAEALDDGRGHLGHGAGADGEGDERHPRVPVPPPARRPQLLPRARGARCREEARLRDPRVPRVPHSHHAGESTFLVSPHHILLHSLANYTDETTRDVAGEC
mmetsp:Transcript_14490/g.34941  ORF Transcript_14490/g.34941 Transcript_14490/m.34941 type:complete len:325 (-) Transcript_14490:661-1635(-)